MKFFRALLANLIFLLNVLLIFLAIYRDRMVVPVWLQPAGRMHPLLLHLPIGLLLLVTLLVIFRNSFRKKAFHNFLNFVLYFGALTAVLTAIMGLLLSREGGYDETQLDLHLVTGTGVSIFSAALLWVSLYAFKQGTAFYFTLITNTVVLLAAGHLGAELTHGEGFLFQPLSQDKAEVITDSTSLYAAAIHPILKAKCMSCHNERKVKGGLNMASLEKILKGGKHGAIWVAHDPEKSTIIKRIHLPEEHDDHMPPAGKTQLTAAESGLLFQWILAGADVKTAWTKFAAADTLRKLANGFIHREVNKEEVHYTFPFASKETVEKLNNPYRTVTQISLDQPALKADFFLSQAYDAKKLEELLVVKEQVVILNLARMPVTDGEAKTVSQFVNLERINLNQTAITGNFLGPLKALTHLQSVSMTGTAVDRTAVEGLATIPSLKEIFLWGSKIPAGEQVALQKQFPKIQWNSGYATAEVLRLTPPLLVNENPLLKEGEQIILKHNLPGTHMRYTIDGADPDSLKSTLYAGPIDITQYTRVKARAFKDGWYGSQPSEFYFFKSGVRPLDVSLVNPPDKDYKGEGAATLTDGKKGMADNFRDIAWLGFREKPFIALFTLDPAKVVNTVTVSYCENFTSYLLPPASIELWGGDNESNLKLIQKIIPVQPASDGPRLVKGIVFSVGTQKYTHYKLIAQPVPRVPVWVSKKPDKGWFFVDEVIFN